MATSKSGPAKKKKPIVVLYGVGINKAARTGKLSEMKAVAKKAEAYLKKAEEIKAALKNLNAAIAKASK